ncbi:hypothetical protein [Gaopeijia maritima]|uniref:Uncharacterized protein n=1 Tax=Gaopeijia maritima TaxID=3119007 RepID=A0ABU9E698_9BACT
MLRRLATAAMLVLLLLGQGCATWYTVDTATPALPERVRVVDQSGESTLLDDPYTEGDDLVGIVAYSDERFRRPLSELTSIEGRMIDPGLTILAVVGTGLLFLGMTLSAAFAGST